MGKLEKSLVLGLALSVPFWGAAEAAVTVLPGQSVQVSGTETGTLNYAGLTLTNTGGVGNIYIAPASTGGLVTNISNSTFTATTPAINSGYAGGVYTIGPNTTKNIITNVSDCTISITTGNYFGAGIASYGYTTTNLRGHNVINDYQQMADAIRVAEGSTLNIYDTLDINELVPGSNNAQCNMEVNYGGSDLNVYGTVNITKNVGGFGTALGVGVQAQIKPGKDYYNIKNSGVLNIVTNCNTENITVYKDGVFNLDGALNLTNSGSSTKGIYATGNGEVNGVGNMNMQLQDATSGGGIYAENTATVDFAGNATITATTGNALFTKDSATITLNKNLDKDVALTGDIITNDTSKAIVNFANANSFLTGAANHLGTADELTLNLSNGAKWNVTGDSVVNNLALTSNASMDMFAVNTFNTVTVDTALTGNGNMYFDTDLQKSFDNKDVATDSDKLVINGSSTGTYKVHVKDDSLNTGVPAEGYLLLISDATGGGNFVGEALETGGLFKYKPILTDTDPTGYTSVPTGFRNWYLTGFAIDSSDPIQPGPSVLGGSGLNRYLNYRYEIDNLLLRLGELRDNPNEHGVWARIKANNQSVKNSVLDTSKQVMYQVGYDHLYKDNEQGKRYVGFGIDHIVGSQTYVENAEGDSSSTSLTVYNTWLGNKGHYLDLVAKAGRMGQSIDYRGGVVDRGDDHNWYYAASVEYGRKKVLANGMYFEPQAQLSLGRINSANFTSDNGLKVSHDAINSAIFRAGSTVGKRYGSQEGKISNVYGKAFWNHEFGGNIGQGVQLGTDSYSSSKSYGDSWWTLGLGANTQLDHKTNAYLDLEKTFGGDIKTKWQVNAGLRWMW